MAAVTQAWPLARPLASAGVVSEHVNRLLSCSGHQNATIISLLLELRLALSLGRATEILAALEVDLSHLGSIPGLFSSPREA